MSQCPHLFALGAPCISILSSLVPCCLPGSPLLWELPGSSQRPPFFHWDPSASASVPFSLHPVHMALGDAVLIMLGLIVTEAMQGHRHTPGQLPPPRGGTHSP